MSDSKQALAFLQGDQMRDIMISKSNGISLAALALPPKGHPQQGRQTMRKAFRRDGPLQTQHFL